MFKYFIKKHIMDIGGMENEEEIEVLDGSGKLLMEIIEGNSSKIIEFYKCEYD